MPPSKSNKRIDIFISSSDDELPNQLIGTGPALPTHPPPPRHPRAGSSKSGGKGRAKAVELLSDGEDDRHGANRKQVATGDLQVGAHAGPAPRQPSPMDLDDDLHAPREFRYHGAGAMPPAQASVPQGIPRHRPPVALIPPPAPLVLSPETQENLDLSSIIAIVPDVLPSHALALLRAQPFNTVERVEIVLEQLFEDPAYPRAGAGVKGKKRARDSDSEEAPREQQKDEVDWEDKLGKRERLGAAYELAALTLLYSDFLLISKNDIRDTFFAKNYLYAPSLMALRKAMDAKTDKERGFKLLGSGRQPPKGKGKATVCEPLEREREAIWRRIEHLKAEVDEAVRRDLLVQEEIARGEFFECGCCFGEEGFSKLVTCTEGCQFCQECVTAHVNNQIGSRKYVLPCISTSECTAFFPESICKPFLPATTLAGLHKLKQEQEVDSAEMEGLAKCPFCPFAYIIENEQERLFHCQREDCMKVSCRQCQREDHLPKTCAEMDADKKINGLHVVEEAMSAALIRKCPKCSNPYLKEDGCNKITCPTCKTLSCYICYKVIKGYEHFRNAGSNAQTTEKGSTCDLWDKKELQREFHEVEAARIAAAAIVAEQNPAVGQDDLGHLNLAPPPVPERPAAHAAGPYPALANLAGRADQALAQFAQAQAQVEALRQHYAYAMPMYRAAAIPNPPQLNPAALAADAARMNAIRQQNLAHERERQEARQRDAARRLQQVRQAQEAEQAQARARNVKRARLLGRRR